MSTGYARTRVSPATLAAARAAAALAAAKQRFGQAARNAERMAEDLAHAEARFGAVGASMPHFRLPRSETVADWSNATAELEEQTETVARAISEARRREDLKSLSFLTDSLTATLTQVASPRTEMPRSSTHLPPPQSEPSAEVTGATYRSPRGVRNLSEVAAGVLATLLPAAETSLVLELCKQLEEMSPDDWRSEMVLESLQRQAQNENERARRGQANQALIKSLLSELDEVAGPEVDALRQQLAEFDPYQALPPGTTERVRVTAREASERTEEEVVAQALAEVLGDLGYQIDENFAHNLRAGEAVAPLPGDDHRGVVFRVDRDRLMYAVARYDESGRRQPRADQMAEGRWCADLPSIANAMERRNVAFEVEQANPPGARDLYLRREAPSWQLTRRPRRLEEDDDARQQARQR